jgi:hypothetical protein
MAFNGSGVYNLVMDWVADAAAGIKIRADRHMTQDQDFASGISNCIARDGQSIISANTPWNGKRITNLGDPSAAQDAMTRAYFDAQMALPGVSRAFVQAQVKTTTGSIVLHAPFWSRCRAAAVAAIRGHRRPLVRAQPLAAAALAAIARNGSFGRAGLTVRPARSARWQPVRPPATARSLSMAPVR